MDEKIRILGDPQMIAALEANLEEEMMCFGRGLAGAEIYYDGEIEGFITGRGGLNGILRTHMREQAEALIEAKIAAVKSYFRARGVKTFGWSVGQDCQPANMEDYLKRAGMAKISEENVGMALALDEMCVEERKVEGLEIREVADLEGLKVLRQLEMEGFGASEKLAQNYYEMYAGVGFGQEKSWRHFTGWLNERPVALASLLFHAGVAGIYGVTTIPEARRHGIARRMVLHAIEQARQAGYHIVILSPTDMSERIYRELGFREYTCVRHYMCEL